MKENKIQQSLQWLFSRVIIFYVCLFAVLSLWVSQEAFKVAKFLTLNRLLPSPRILLDLNARSGKPDLKEMERFVFYYQKVNDYFGDTPEGHFLLAYSYYHTGKKAMALNHFRKSKELGEEFFATHYNLGILALQSKQYLKAQGYFEDAVNTPPQYTGVIMTQIKVFQQILLQHDQPRVYLRETMVKNYRQAKKFIALIQVMTKNQQEAQAELYFKDQKIEPILF